MHEVGIVASALQAAEAHAAGRAIARVRLRVGTQTGVVAEALQHAWTALRPGTLAEEALLMVELVPATWRCPDCTAAFTAAGLAARCPRCAAPAVFAGGCGLELADLEVIDACASTAAAM
jgi:hydrogenase nickel incorporation protein HypA/HybF